MKHKRSEAIFIGVLAFIMLGMSVGFAAYSSKLNIGGTTTVSANKWSIHFDPNAIQLAELIAGKEHIYTPGLHTGELIQEISLDPNNLNFSIKAKLNNPQTHYDQNGCIDSTLGMNGDAVLAQLYIINEGSFDAIIKDINVQSDSIADKFVMTRLEARYQESADSQAYSIYRHYIGPKNRCNTNDTDLTIQTLKPAQNGYPRIQIELSLGYETPSGPDSLPQEDVTINTEVKVNAEQA